MLKKYRGRYAETIRGGCARNDHRARLAEQQRTEKLDKLSKRLDKAFAAGTKNLIGRLEKVFGEHNGRYRR